MRNEQHRLPIPEQWPLTLCVPDRGSRTGVALLRGAVCGPPQTLAALPLTGRGALSEPLADSSLVRVGGIVARPVSVGLRHEWEWAAA